MQLNLPVFDIKTRKTRAGKTEVFDAIRKKYVALTPEEWVRQHFLHFLVSQKGYPPSLIAVEKGLKVNQMQKRFDAVVFDKRGNPLVLIEFKSPKVELDQKTFDQVSMYNLKMKVNYLVISNGLKHYCCRMDYEKDAYYFLKEIPSYNEL
jgi:type I site-specific restriction endonuclease